VPPDYGALAKAPYPKRSEKDGAKGRDGSPSPSALPATIARPFLLAAISG